MKTATMGLDWPVVGRPWFTLINTSALVILIVAGGRIWTPTGCGCSERSVHEGLFCWWRRGLWQIPVRIPRWFVWFIIVVMYCCTNTCKNSQMICLFYHCCHVLFFRNTGFSGYHEIHLYFNYSSFTANVLVCIGTSQWMGLTAVWKKIFF